MKQQPFIEWFNFLSFTKKVNFCCTYNSMLNLNDRMPLDLKDSEIKRIWELERKKVDKFIHNFGK